MGPRLLGVWDPRLLGISFLGKRNRAGLFTGTTSFDCCAPAAQPARTKSVNTQIWQSQFPQPRHRVSVVK